jgi:hypothetical protein
MNSVSYLYPESLIKLIYSVVWAIMVLVPIQRRVYEWVTYLLVHFQSDELYFTVSLAPWLLSSSILSRGFTSPVLSLCI